MAPDDKTTGMKSAYDLALERLEQQGIEKPRDEGLGPEIREQIAEIRNQSEAKLAQLEILHRDSLRKMTDPSERAEAEKGYAEERQRVEARRDREIDRLRSQA